MQIRIGDYVPEWQSYRKLGYTDKEIGTMARNRYLESQQEKQVDQPLVQLPQNPVQFNDNTSTVPSFEQKMPDIEDIDKKTYINPEFLKQNQERIIRLLKYICPSQKIG